MPRIWQEGRPLFSFDYFLDFSFLFAYLIVLFFVLFLKIHLMDKINSHDKEINVGNYCLYLFMFKLLSV